MWHTSQSAGQYAYIAQPSAQQQYAQSAQQYYTQQQHAQQHPTYAQHAQTLCKINPAVAAILRKLLPWDKKGRIAHVLKSPSEQAAIAYFSTILPEVGEMLQQGRKTLGASEQAILIAFFAQMADRYPQYNLYASVTSIIAKLG